jgi:uncharacterized membrane-anchored protein
MSDVRLTLSADALAARVPLPLRALLGGLILCGLILALVLDRASILRNGQEVRLATLPIDPRDLFRGDYVILNYEISQISLTRLNAEGLNPRDGEALYVTLRPGADGRARAVAVARARPAPAPGEIILLGRHAGAGFCQQPRGGANPTCDPRDSMIRLTYGLESFFVPEGEGRAIETTAASRVEIVAAVASSGKAAIKRLLIDGKPVYDEPPY